MVEKMRVSSSLSQTLAVATFPTNFLFASVSSGLVIFFQLFPPLTPSEDPGAKTTLPASIQFKLSCWGWSEVGEDIINETNWPHAGNC